MYNEYRTQLIQGSNKIHKIIDSCECTIHLEAAINVIDSFTNICEKRTNQLYKIHKRHPFNKRLKHEFEMYHIAANEIINNICTHAQTTMNEFKEIESNLEFKDNVIINGFYPTNDEEIE